MTDLIALVQCGSAKQSLPVGERVPARELYTSTYFKSKRAVAEELCDEWYIVSGEYGLVHPDEELPYYETDITEESPEEIFWWHAQMSGDFAARGLGQREDVTFVVLVGRNYLDLEHTRDTRTLRTIINRQPGAAVYPFEGLGGLPGQQRWMGDCLDEGRLLGVEEVREVVA